MAMTPRLRLAMWLVALLALGTSVVAEQGPPPETASGVPIARPGVVTTTEGQVIEGTLEGKDPDGDFLRFSIVSAPWLGTVSLDEATGTFRYQPVAGASGYDTFTFQVEDAVGATSTATEGVIIVSGWPQWPGQTVRASVASGGGQGNRASGEPSVSADGRYVAFASLASSPVAGDTNGAWDVFVHDRQSGQTSRVSVGPQGVPANDGSGQPAISADGRYVAFASLASNLVAGDTNGTSDIFVHDRASGQTERVSVANDGIEAEAGTFSEAPAISADGRYVAFTSTAATLVAGDGNGVDDVFVHDRVTRTTWRVSVGPGGNEADGWSYGPALSADGRLVVFTSVASNLVAGDTNGVDDVFVHDRQTGETRRVSVGPGGAEADGWSYHPALSADGRFVSFVSQATNLVAGDGNGLADVFVHDRQTGQMSRVSVATGGGEANGWSDQPAVSADGRYVAFFSAASNLTLAPMSGIGEIFVHDRRSGETQLVSVSSAGIGTDTWSDQPALSADGRFVAFRSEAGTLVTEDTNGWADIFVVGGVSVWPRTQHLPGAGGLSVVDVSFVYEGSPWDAASLDPWIAILDQSATTGNGAVSFRVAVNDGVARTGTIVVAAQPVTITQAERTAPMAHDGTFTTNEDVSVAGQLAATDPNGDPLAFAIVSNGVLGTVTVTDAATGAFVYVPTPDASGTDSFTFAANDGTSQSNVATVTVTITAINDAPAALDDGLQTAEDVTVAGFLGWTDVDGPTSALRVITNGSLGTATITDATTGAFTYVPNSNVFGTDVFTFIASDGAADSNVGTVAVTITPVNDAPVALDGALTIDEDSAGTGALAALDVDGPVSTFTIVANGAHGVAAITDAATGTFTYTPQAHVFGTDTFAFAVHDGSVYSNAGTVTMTIAPVNDPPVAQTGLVTTTAGMPIDGALRASDLDTDALTFSMVGVPALGTVSLDALMGTFRYTPAAGANGYDTFTFQVEDAAGATSTASEGVIIVSAEPQWPGQTVRASVASGGGQGNRASGEPSVSADGRYVAFASLASSLVAGDTNGTWDVFVHDRQSGQTSRVSVGPQGAQSIGWSGQPAISADGRYVAFASLASNLVAGDSNGTWDIFVRDRASGQTERVSVASDGTEAEAGTFSEAPALSADGRYVAFTSTAATLVAGDANGVDDVFVRDRVTGATWRVSVGPGGTEADGWSYGPALSADGRYVAFTSVASTLIADDTNGIDDVFVHDRQTGETRRVSVGGDGSDADGWSYHPVQSADGRFVSFVSQATNLVADDGNGLADVFVHDRETGATSRVSVATGGGEANGWSDQPALSADGRYIAFFSAASNLASGTRRGPWDVFVHDRRTGGTRRVSVSGAGTPANGVSDQPAMSADGRFVAFRSAGSNLVPGDANGRSDVFVAGGVSVAPASQSFAARGGTGAVSTAFVYPGTTWHAVSHAPWITLTGQSSTQGSGSVNYSVASNPGGARTGTLTVAAQTIAITQGQNHAPQAEDGRIGTSKNVPVGGQLTAIDPDGDSLTYSIVTNGTLGTATIADASTAAFTYTPNLHAFGTDTFTFKASDGIADSAVATITVDIVRFLPALSIDDVSVPEGDNGPTALRFVVSLSSPIDRVVAVNFTTADGTAQAGSDYTAASGTLTFPSSSTSPQIIEIAINGDRDVESDETLRVMLSGPVNAALGRAAATGTIVNDDVAPVAFGFETAAIDVSSGGGTALVIALPAPAGPDGAEVTLESLDPSIVMVPSVVRIPPGNSEGYVSVDGQRAGVTTVQASFPGSPVAQLQVTVLRQDFDVSLPQRGIAVGQHAHGTLVLRAPAPAGGATIALTTANPERLRVVTPLISVAAGASKAPFEIEALGAGIATFTASGLAGVEGAVSGTVTGVLAPGSTSLTTGELIAQARDDGTITAEQAAVYGLLAGFGSPSLPAQYRGVPSRAPDEWGRSALMESYSRMSDDQRAEIAPYLLPPIYEGSWGDPALFNENGLRVAESPSRAPRSDRARSGALEAAPSAHTAEVSADHVLPGWKTIKTTHFKIWYRTNPPAGLYTAAQAKSTAHQIAADAEKVYDAHSPEGEPLVPLFPWVQDLTPDAPDQILSDRGYAHNGGDGLYDIYVVEASANFFGRTTGYLLGCGPEPSYIYISPKRDQKDIRATIAHEFMHAIQWATPKYPGCGENQWMWDATAEWAENHVFRFADTEHNEAGNYFNAQIDPAAGIQKRRRAEFRLPIDQTAGSIEYCKGGYCDYPLFFFLDGQYGHGIMPAIFTAWGHADEIAAIDLALSSMGSGGLWEAWHKFTRTSWNDYPDHVDDEFFRWDNVEGGVLPTYFKEITHDQIDVSLFGEQEQVVFEADIRQRMSLEGAGPIIYRLSATPLYFKFIDENVSYVIFENRPANNLNLQIWGRVKINGAWKPVEDWSKKPFLTWCRDVSDERIEEMAVIYSNGSVAGRGLEGIDLSHSTPRLLISNAGCWQWQGTSSVTNINPYGGTVVEKATVTFERLRSPESPEGGYEESFSPVSGVVSYQRTGDFVPGCSLTVGPASGPVADPLNPLMSIGLLDPEDGTLNRHAFLGGGGTEIPDVITVLECGTDPPVRITTSGPVLSFWQGLPGEGAKLGADGRTLTGRTEENFFGVTTISEWSFTAKRQ